MITESVSRSVYPFERPASEDSSRLGVINDENLHSVRRVSDPWHHGRYRRRTDSDSYFHLEAQGVADDSGPERDVASAPVFKTAHRQPVDAPAGPTCPWSEFAGTRVSERDASKDPAATEATGAFQDFGPVFSPLTERGDAHVRRRPYWPERPRGPSRRLLSVCPW